MISRQFNHLRPTIENTQDIANVSQIRNCCQSSVYCVKPYPNKTYDLPILYLKYDLRKDDPRAFSLAFIEACLSQEGCLLIAKDLRRQGGTQTQAGSDDSEET